MARIDEGRRPQRPGRRRGARRGTRRPHHRLGPAGRHRRPRSRTGGGAMGGAPPDARPDDDGLAWGEGAGSTSTRCTSRTCSTAPATAGRPCGSTGGSSGAGCRATTNGSSPSSWRTSRPPPDGCSTSRSPAWYVFLRGVAHHQRVRFPADEAPDPQLDRCGSLAPAVSGRPDETQVVEHGQADAVAAASLVNRGRRARPARHMARPERTALLATPQSASARSTVTCTTPLAARVTREADVLLAVEHLAVGVERQECRTVDDLDARRHDDVEAVGGRCSGHGP